MMDKLERQPDRQPDQQSSQQEVIAFLADPTTHVPTSNGRGPGGAVARISTHISHVFLIGDRAYKLKRAVKLPYLDFSTVELRRGACEREVALNRRTAPELYEGTTPVTRAADGRLMLAGDGQPIDWLVVMRRFDDDARLDRVADRGLLTEPLLRRLADTIADFHSRAEAAPGGGARAMRAIIEENEHCLGDAPPGCFDPIRIDRLQTACRDELGAVAGLLDRRRDQAKVRQCHGDLHLRNICVVDGRPVLFDAIEFNDALARTDVLYDLAFLLMDLIHRGDAATANLVFNRYLDRTDETDGLRALPVFLALRAAIRAHVTASDDAKGRGFREPRSYLDLALSLVWPQPGRLVAIGGLSGTGKSTLAYGLAPFLGGAPGARVIRSDVIRKRLFGVAPEDRLPKSAYAKDVTKAVYAALVDEAGRVVRSGHAAIADAVFADPEERRAVRDAAAAARVPFDGLWLEAPPHVLEERIAARRDDASDADLAVLRRQMAYDIGSIDWTRLDVAHDGALALASARSVLGHGASDAEAAWSSGFDGRCPGQHFGRS